MVNEMQAMSYHNRQEKKHASGSRKQPPLPSVHPKEAHTLLVRPILKDTPCLCLQTMHFFHKRMWQTRHLDNVVTGPLRQ